MHQDLGENGEWSRDTEESFLAKEAAHTLKAVQNHEENIWSV